LPRFLEAAEAAEFSSECDGSHVRGATKRLQRIDDRSQLLRRDIDGLIIEPAPL